MTPILTTTSTLMCPHGGMAQLITTNTEAVIDGAPALLVTDVHPIVGCPFAPVAPSPCITIIWSSGAVQTKVHEVPVLLQTSIGSCLNAAGLPQGLAVIVQVQQRALGT
jgi:hypothetical protein